MDYPHPLVTLKADGTIDLSDAYAVGIGEWDKVAVRYGYGESAPGHRRRRGAEGHPRRGRGRGPALPHRSGPAVPPARRPLGQRHRPGRRAAPDDAGAARRARIASARQPSQRDAPLALIEEALVPLFLHHRYQVEAAASALGGQHYIYALRGDGEPARRPVPAAEQKAALDALAATLTSSELVVPPRVLALLAPRPAGFDMHRELFPRYTGLPFDPVTPGLTAADVTLTAVLDPARAARLIVAGGLRRHAAVVRRRRRPDRRRRSSTIDRPTPTPPRSTGPSAAPSSIG